MNRAVVRPIKTYYVDDELGATVIRGVGYRASCPCGWRGLGRFSFAAARADRKEHKCPQG